MSRFEAIVRFLCHWFWKRLQSFTVMWNTVHCLWNPETGAVDVIVCTNGIVTIINVFETILQLHHAIVISF